MDESQNFIKRIHDRLHIYDKNYMCLVVGATGSGKSTLSLRLCELLQPSFNISQVVFSAADFVARLKEPDIVRGSCILWDECSVGFENVGSRNFMTTINKAIGFFLQGFRCRNTATFFSAPSAMMIDSQLRALAHALIRTLRIDRQTSRVVCRYYQLQPNPLMMNKIYYHKPSDRTGKEIDILNIHKPSPGLWHDYLEKKSAWFEALGIDVGQRLNEKAMIRPEPITLNYPAMAREMRAAYPDREKFTIGFIRSQHPELSESRARIIHALICEGV